MSENKITFPVKLASNNPKSFGIVDATEISGHRSVETLSDLYTISDPVLSISKDGSDAIGQEWFVVSEDCKYRLDNWENRKSVTGWTKLQKQELINTKQSVSEKDQPGGYAGLDSNGKLPIEKTYGDTATVTEVETYESLPVTGLSGVIYYVSNTGMQYKWSGSSYVDITDGADNAKKNETSIFDCSNGTSTKYYTSLSAAINVVPPVYRTSNRIISYLSTENATTKAVNYQYNGIDSTTWADLTKWERVPNQSDLAEIRSDLSELEQKVGDIDDTKLGGVIGKNLFNKDSQYIIKGKYVNQNGVIITLNDMEYISYAVNEGDNFAFIFPYYYYAFFNGDTFISGGSNKSTITAPSNANKMYISLQTSNEALFQIEKGTTATSYEAYSLTINSDKSIKDNSIENKKLKGYPAILESIENVTFKDSQKASKADIIVPDEQSNNLFILNSIIKGYWYRNTDGAMTKIDGFNISPLISVKPSSIYTKQGSSCCLYDSDRKFISFVNANTPAISTTAKTAYIGLSIQDGYEKMASLFEGEYTGPYIKGERLISTKMVKGLNELLNPINEIPNLIVDTYIQPLAETKNKFDVNKFTHKGYWSMSGSAKIIDAPNDDWGYLPLIENYGIKTYSKNGGILVCMYNSAKEYIGRSLGSEITFTTTSDVKYLGLSINPNYVSTAQFVEGSSVPNYYEPYQKRYALSQLQFGENVVIVGRSNCQFTSIKDAVSYCKAFYPSTPCTILILPGTYVEDVSIVGTKISIVGVSRDNCIIQTKENDYQKPPIEMAGGNTIENITLLATTEDDAGGTHEGAYAVHHDYSGEGESFIRNCKCISYGSCAIGIGSHNNQQIHIENCYLYTNNDNSNNKVTLLFHNRQPNDATNQSLEVKNCILKNDNYSPYGLIDSNHISGGGGDDARDTILRFYGNYSYARGNNSSGDVYGTEDMTGTGKAWGYMKLSADSYGNNVNALNY